MSDATWLPGILVLAAGLVAGVIAALRLRRTRALKRRPESDPESRLALRDLERRRDDLYRRLRSNELSDGDRAALEKAAARVLRDLDRLGDGAPPPPTPSEPAVAAPATPATGLMGQHPLLVGFLFGAGLVVLVGALVYWAVRDAAPRPDAAATAPTDEPHGDESTLPPEVRQELARLEAALAANPTDLLSFKRLALARLDAGLYLEAFEDSKQILAAVPEDPDGLFIQGVVRVTMGQFEAAVETLDRVLARFPEHLDAMVYRGLALAQSGRLDQAVDTWEIGLELAGGRHPEIERLLQMAREQPPPAAPPPAAVPAAPAPASQPLGPAYRATIALPPDARPAPGAVLFVFLRPGETGPPVAVKRIASPSFPAQVVLGADDAMMAGAVLPGEGFLVARLDADGSASTRDEGDLEVTSAAVIDQPLDLVLGSIGM